LSLCTRVCVFIGVVAPPAITKAFPPLESVAVSSAEVNVASNRIGKLL
jgi:hypothetical protein